MRIDRPSWVAKDTSSEDLQRLEGALAGGRAVPYIGAGFAAPTLLGWSGMLKKIFTNLHNKNDVRGIAKGPINEALKNKDLPLAALLLEQLTQPETLRNELAQIFGKNSWISCPVIEARCKSLLQGRWRGIVTTNYDLSLSHYRQLIFGRADAHLTLGRPSPNNLSQGLGSILRRRTNEPWLVHLHGTIDDEPLLSLRDYDKQYYEKGALDGFLTALFLSTDVIFLGCGLTDEVVHVRRRLKSRFPGLPPEFALLAGNREHKIRSKYLAEEVGIIPIFYANTKKDNYKNFQPALDWIANQSKNGERLEMTLNDVAQIRSLSLPERLDRLDAANRALYDYLATDRPLRDILYLPDGDPGETLLEMTDAERYYRLFFLSQLDVIREIPGTPTHYARATS